MCVKCMTFTELQEIIWIAAMSITREVPAEVPRENQCIHDGNPLHNSVPKAKKFSMNISAHYIKAFSKLFFNMVSVIVDLR